MDDINRSISEYVKTGQYYLDARKWYANKFVYVVSERAYILLFLILFSTALMILGFFFMQTSPAPPEITYVSKTDDIARYYSVIFPAGKSTDKPQIQVTKYMLAKYVRVRETYVFSAIEDQLNFIKNTTVPQEYLSYANMMSINNPSSPMMLYQDENIKKVDIQDIKLLEAKEKYQKAIVYFKSSLKNIATNKVVSENMFAIISFKIDDIELLLNNGAKKLNFLVLEYSLGTNKS